MIILMWCGAVLMRFCTTAWKCKSMYIISISKFRSGYYRNCFRRYFCNIGMKKSMTKSESIVLSAWHFKQHGLCSVVTILHCISSQQIFGLQDIRLCMTFYSILQTFCNLKIYKICKTPTKCTSLWEIISKYVCIDICIGAGVYINTCTCRICTVCIYIYSACSRNTHEGSRS